MVTYKSRFACCLYPIIPVVLFEHRSQLFHPYLSFSGHLLQMDISNKRQVGYPNLPHRPRHCDFLYSSDDGLGNIPASLVAVKQINISHLAKASLQITHVSTAHVCFDRNVPRDMLDTKPVLLPFVKV